MADTIVENPEEAPVTNSKFRNALTKVGTDIRQGVSKKVSSVKSDVTSKLKDVPDTILSGMDPLLGGAIRGAIKGVPKASKYVKGLFSEEKKKKEPKEKKEPPTPEGLSISGKFIPADDGLSITGSLKPLDSDASSGLSITGPITPLDSDSSSLLTPPAPLMPAAPAPLTPAENLIPPAPLMPAAPAPVTPAESLTSTESIGPNDNEILQQTIRDQTEKLLEIQNNTGSSRDTLNELLAFMRGESLDEFEKDREKQIRDEQMLDALKSIGAGGTLGLDGEEETGGFLNALGDLKEKLLGLGVGLGGAAAAARAFRGRVANAASRAGQAVANTRAGRATRSAGRRIAQTRAGQATGRAASSVGRAATGARAAVAGASGAGAAATAGAGAAATAGSTAGTSAASGAAAANAAKYPKLLKFARFIRGVPGLGALAAGVEGIMIASDDEMPPEEKKRELARVIGGALGGTSGVKLGSILGTLALPGVGTLAGALAGGVGGYFLGGWAAKKIAGSLLEQPTSEEVPMPESSSAEDVAPQSTDRRDQAGRSGATNIGRQYRNNATGNESRVARPNRRGNRSSDLGRAQQDRASAAMTSANRSSAQPQNNTNISSNVVNNNQGVIRHRPSAGAQPDNVSDTIMTTWEF